MRVGLIACRVIQAEVDAFTRDSTQIVRREFLEMGLHDRPAVLHTRLAAAVERAEADAGIEAVVLAYGLCGLALVDLAPRRLPLVVPRAHDCLTLLLGCRKRYAACMRAEPGTHWYSPGWNRERRVPGPDREARLRAEYSERFDSEEVEELIEMERTALGCRSCAAYVDLGLPGDDEPRRYAERCAEFLGWRFERHEGDPALLRDLLYGPWDDERFLVVEPGRRIAHSVDSRVVMAAAVAAETGTDGDE